MTSIITNVAAMSALQTLRSIGQNMESTQARVSSGLRVGEAADNAAYWSIATTMRSDNMALSSVSDALGLGAAKVDTASAGMESAIEVVKEIKAKLVTATEEGVDRTKVQEEIGQAQKQLASIAQGASFYGENWLVGVSTLGATTPAQTRTSRSLPASFAPPVAPLTSRPRNTLSTTPQPATPCSARSTPLRAFPTRQAFSARPARSRPSLPSPSTRLISPSMQPLTAPRTWPKP